MSPKSTAAVYAQMRRDNETDTRDALKALIPPSFLTEDLENDGTLNPTSKVMVAAKDFISSIDTSSSAWPGAEDDLHALKDCSTPFLIPSHLDIDQPEDLRQLRQVAQRLVHKVEENMQGSNAIPKRLQKLVANASNTLIDLIEEVEQTAGRK